MDSRRQERGHQSLGERLSIAKRSKESPAPTLTSATYARNHATVPSTRRAVREHLERHGTPSALIADFELIVSELVTNVVIHGVGDNLTLRIQHFTDAVSVMVEGAASRRRVPHMDDWHMPAPNQVGGRGLAVVAAIASTVAVNRTAGRLGVTATCLLKTAHMP